MIVRSIRKAVPALVAGALLAAAGCSFQGSLTDASPGSHAGSADSEPGGSATGTTGAVSSGHAGSPGTPASSTGGTPGASPATGSRTGGQPTRPGRCHTGDLSGSLVPGSPGAGQRYATVVLTNVSGTTCTVHGYGGIGLVDSAGAPLPTQQVRVSSPAPTLVTLRSHQSAHSQLHWGAVPGTGDAQTGACQPTPAALHVIPPDETTPLSIPWTQGPVCEQGTVDQQVYTG